MKTAMLGRGAPLALVLALGACAGTQDPDRAAVEYRGTDPSGGTSTAAPANADIRSYDGYQAVRTRKGDTVADAARRVGIPPADLAAYNGLSPDQELRGGAELVLPPRPDGYDTAAPSPQAGSDTRQAEATATGIESAPLAMGVTGAEAPPEADPSGPEAGTTEPGETDWSPEIAAAAIDRASDGGAGEEEDRLGAPPSSADPLPPEPSPAPDLETPDLGQYQTPRSRPERAADPEAVNPEPPREAGQAEPTETASASPSEPATDSAATTRDDEQWRRSGGLMRPVQAPVALPYGEGPDGSRNEGVDFAAEAGAPVVAAADGEVALVSKALGGLGTIVLLRHPDEMLTVYGRLADVTVAKGAIVSRGQRIGAVAQPEAPAEPRLHFEVREGARSVDPMAYLDN